ncbi:transcriptional regulator, TetR family [Seinonella peptonophila]|uniref:Transcriptional regulator, TetR family n=1 Tax=Seinonella peptonophila TaxID=112248 RepID=A0A1M4X7L6_9BACL|nr:TetR/AcrR family transcriptional regulator [Seinonella peptonophila]SHE89383.1 transcriptional regulator, TetR family [Seinonella peptonophila]
MKNRILEVAQILFSRCGYAGTSINDIAQQVGTSKAGIYYHFRSKEAILDEVLSQPMKDLSQLIEQAKKNHFKEEQLLRAYINGIVKSGKVMYELWNDLSIQDQLQHHQINEQCEELVYLLAGSQPSESDLVRARAAMAVAQTAIQFIANGDGSIDKKIQTELLNAALRVLN